MMNEQIFDLLKQATKEVNPDDREWVFRKVDQVKFAELIIQKCIEQVNEAIPETNCSASGAYRTAKNAIIFRIKETFGV